MVKLQWDEHVPPNGKKEWVSRFEAFTFVVRPGKSSNKTWELMVNDVHRHIGSRNDCQRQAQHFLNYELGVRQLADAESRKEAILKLRADPEGEETREAGQRRKKQFRDQVLEDLVSWEMDSEELNPDCWAEYEDVEDIITDWVEDMADKYVVFPPDGHVVKEKSTSAGPWYVWGEDMAQGLVGPFASYRDAVQHIELWRQRGEASVCAHDNARILPENVAKGTWAWSNNLCTPEEDRKPKPFGKAIPPGSLAEGREKRKKQWESEEAFKKAICSPEKDSKGKTLLEVLTEDGAGEACPGCGKMPGEGLTDTCSHPHGCGFWREEEKNAGGK